MRHHRLLATIAGLALLAALPAGCAKDEDLLARVKSEAPAASVTAVQLATDYKANEVKADVTYKDKVIRVTGKVHKIEKDLGGHPVVLLLGDGLVAIRCVYDASFVEPVAAYNKGDTVSVKGMCQGKLGSVNFRGCMPM